MDIPVTCNNCHTAVKDTDYFCYNCGKNLKPQPPATDITGLLKLYIGSLLLPPMGLWWGFRYIRQNNRKAQIAGLIAIIGTIVYLIIIMKITTDLFTQVNMQVNQQLQDLQGF